MSSKNSGLALTSRDIELFRWLWMLRILTLGQLRRLGYFQPETRKLSSLDNVRKRLRRLWNAGYFSGEKLLETKERLYMLAEPALPELRRRYDIEQFRLYKPRGLETMRHVHHAVMVSECAVRIVESIRGSQIELVDLPPHGIPFYHTHAIGNIRRKKHVERFITQEDLRVYKHTRPMRIRPDLVFALRQGERSRLYFVEADRGSEGVKEIETKQLAYSHYAKYLDPRNTRQYLWQRYGTVGDFRVLFITTDERRVKNLVSRLETQPGFELMALADLEAVQQNNLVFDSIWTNHRGTDRALARRS